MVRGGHRSRQVMQKFVDRISTDWDTTTFLESTVLAVFDEEVTVKRIRVSSYLDFSDANDKDLMFQWAILQLQTENPALTPAGVYNQMTEDNLVIVTGQFEPGSYPFIEYDHTITMRKLKGSSLYLIVNLADVGTSLAGTARQYTYSQTHYLED